MKRLMKGFTMIELLIVIAVLGILAVAVLSAINPIEQINRGKDTGSRSDAEQLLSAIDRFYAGKGYYPWQLNANSTNTAVTPLTELDSIDIEIGDDAVELFTNLTSTGTQEIKESFATRIVSASSRALWLYNSGVSGESSYVCFVPQSNSFRDTAWNRCLAGADYGALPGDFPPTACPADDTCMTAATASDATGCYSCLP